MNHSLYFFFFSLCSALNIPIDSIRRSRHSSPFQNTWTWVHSCPTVETSITTSIRILRTGLIGPSTSPLFPLKTCKLVARFIEKTTECDCDGILVASFLLTPPGILYLLWSTTSEPLKPVTTRPTSGSTETIGSSAMTISSPKLIFATSSKVKGIKYSTKKKKKLSSKYFAKWLDINWMILFFRYLLFYHKMILEYE